MSNAKSNFPVAKLVILVSFEAQNHSHKGFSSVFFLSVQFSFSPVQGFRHPDPLAINILLHSVRQGLHETGHSNLNYDLLFAAIQLFSLTAVLSHRFSITASFGTAVRQRDSSSVSLYPSRHQAWPSPRSPHIHCCSFSTLSTPCDELVCGRQNSRCHGTYVKTFASVLLSRF